MAADFHQPRGSAVQSTPPEAPGGTEGIPDGASLGQPPSLTVVQAERRRIARALHDTVSQTLTGTYLQALVTTRKLEADGSEAADDVARLTEIIHKAVLELQEVVRGMEPDAE